MTHSWLATTTNVSSKEKQNRRKMKKVYMMPSIEITEIESDIVLAGASKLDPNEDNQTVTPSDEEYDGEFSSKRNHHQTWDDFDDEEEY